MSRRPDSPSRSAQLPAFGAGERQLRAKTFERHMALPTLWERLASTDPAHARQLYLEKQLGVAARLSAAMAASVEPVGLRRQAVAPCRVQPAVPGDLGDHHDISHRNE